jgi:hypothetical protein
MLTRPRTPRGLTGLAIWAALALAAVSLAANAWAQRPSPNAGAPADKGTATAPATARDDRDTDQTGERLAVLDVLLEAKRSLLRIDESRAEQSKRWRDYYEKMARDGKATEDRAVAARDDVLMMAEHVGSERAELKAAETRLKNARRHSAPGNHSAIDADQAREDAEALETLVDSKRSVLRAGESRLEQARRAAERYEALFRRGLATEDQVLAARDDVLMMDAVLAWGRAQLKVAEVRAADARRLATQGGTAADRVDRRLAELEERMIAAEMRADILQHEVGRLRREQPRETHGMR